MKRLYRSKKHKVIGGVCGGIAEYFDISPRWTRAILFIFIAFSVIPLGLLIVLYCIAWIIMPLHSNAGSTIIPSLTHD